MQFLKHTRILLKSISGYQIHTTVFLCSTIGLFKKAETKMAHSSLILRRIDNIIKSEEDKRQYRGLELANQMKVLLVSDPNTDKSAAAMDVNIGFLNDPKEVLGLAHFCEHMLFLGTKKYPNENDYNKFLSEHGGSSNAATYPDHTLYYFDIVPDHLGSALDSFLLHHFLRKVQQIVR
ncbi:hypothetical protein NQ315_005387 [Exocentrus adspersus]|uniref:Peptidase M16 N-terminal domain-containing protein n=1 Tax=Exocentrus adspersus TaxID=1586481 RepID=A0AAV8W204_9CUCU|nr:hypothetical protein NQ315_005387 [Exocentrus adspersus]